MKSYSKEKQDLFAHYLIGSTGTFLDLGSCNPKKNNNSFGLEKIGWNGLCVDRKELQSSYKKNRRSPFLCLNIDDDNFIDEVDNHFLENKHINYISMDVNGNSFKCLTKLINAGYSFDCMTFEHDSYRQEPPDRLKAPAKKLLESSGYTILFEDVTTGNTHIRGYQPWEDWWIDSKSFDKKLLEIKSRKCSFKECISKLENYRFLYKKK